MKRRTFLTALFGVAGSAVCVGKVVADPSDFKGFGDKLSEQARAIEECRKRIDNMKPGDALIRGLRDQSRLTQELKRATGDCA